MTVPELFFDKKLKEILPPVANLTRGDKLEPWIPIRKTLDEFARLETEMSIAQSKRREIIEKLVHLHQPRLN